MSDIGRRTGGSFCIAPGCSNEFYRLKESGRIVHFHVIPVKKPEVLRRWLAALKRLSPPMGPGQRVCSDHFIEADYIEEGAFSEDGRFVRRPTNRLKPDAVPTIFNFSGYSAGDSDIPVRSDPGAALMRSERAQKRACQAEEREVHLASTTRETDKLVQVHSLFEDCIVCRLARSMLLIISNPSPK